MLLTLRLLHHLGFLCFGGLMLYDLLYLVLSGGYIYLSGTWFKIFYFVTIPTFILMVLSGILLIVQKSYYFKKEKWLQKKFVYSLLIMLILIIGVFPEMRRLGDMLEKTGVMGAYVPSLRFLLTSILVIIFYIGNLVVSLRHRNLS